jgi:hypothetical protein
VLAFQFIFNSNIAVGLTFQRAFHQQTGLFHVPLDAGMESVWSTGWCMLCFHQQTVLLLLICISTTWDNSRLQLYPLSMPVLAFLSMNCRPTVVNITCGSSIRNSSLLVGIYRRFSPEKKMRITRLGISNKIDLIAQ